MVPSEWALTIHVPNFVNFTPIITELFQFKKVYGKLQYFASRLVRTLISLLIFTLFISWCSILLWLSNDIKLFLWYQ